MKVYLVGGAVRDALLKLPVTEKDWVVVGSTPQELLDLGYNQVGKDFPVFLHPISKDEYALARTERKQGQGYTGFICDFDKSITLEQDLIRRDLTINAIAQDASGQLIDPFNGVNDINNRIIRHISPAFKEDPLRVLRVARFAARFYALGFRIAAETRALLQEIVQNGELNTLTPERVWKETEKALSTTAPQIYFAVLRECGALTVLFPWFEQLFNVKMAPHSLAVNYGEHTLQALAAIVPLSHDLATRFATICLHLDRLTPADDSVSASDSTGQTIINAVCDQYHIGNDYRKTALLACKYHQRVHQIEQASAEQILQLLNGIDVWRQPYHLEQLIDCCEADYNAQTDVVPKPPYCAKVYLTQAYHIAKSVPVQAIIQQGLQGQAIQQELTRLRIKSLNEWINSVA